MEFGVQGNFTQSNYVQLLRALNDSALSGQLTIQSGRFERVLMAVDGAIVGYHSNLPEDSLSSTLIKKKLLTKKAAAWHKEHLSEGKTLAETLLDSGMLEGDDLVDHYRYRALRGIASPLSLKTGNWRFVSMPWISREVISESVSPSIPIFKPLWDGVKKNLATADLMRMVPVKPQQRFKVLAPGFISEHLNDLPKAAIQHLLSEETDLETIVELAPSSSEDMLRLIWLLFNYGFLDCGSDFDKFKSLLLNSRPIIRNFEGNSKGEQAEGAEEVLKTEDVDGKRSTRLRRLRNLRRGKSKKNTQTQPEEPKNVLSSSEWVQQEYSNRMNCDYYSFLSLSMDDPYTRIDRQSKVLLKKWRDMDRSGELDEDAKESCKTLMNTLRSVYKTLTTPERRTEYDARMKSGNPLLTMKVYATSPPTALEANPADEPPSNMHDIPRKVLKLIETERYADALPHLKKARFENPSSPEVLTYLGWATWKAEGNARDAKDWLQMAVTFDSGRSDAVGYLAKIAMAEGEHDAAKRYLQRTLQIDPNIGWAKVAFDDLKNKA
jgi:hypothetical protein